MASRMRRPEDVRITLLDDDWITIKKHLTIGEQRLAFARMIKRQVSGERPEMDPLMSGISVVAEYLLDWSILDADGAPVVIRNCSVDVKLAALNDLAPEKYNEIDAAIDAHIDAMKAQADAEKKSRDGEKPSLPISASVA